MDIPRYALIAASVLLGLMLLGEWTRFSTAQREAALPTVPMVETEAGGSYVANEMAVSSGVPQDDLDLPAVEDINLTSGQERASAGPSEATAGRIVTVHTDTLEIKIDLEGGDVVGAALKNYPKTLDDPDDPFVLLERNAMRTYVAQSGLVGPDGIDQSQRARYRASQEVYTQTRGEPLEVVIDYAGTDSVLRVSKHFRFEPGSHTIGVHYTVTNRSAQAAQVTPFVQLKRDSSPAPASSGSGMGMQPFLGSALTRPDQRFTKFDFEDMAEDPFRADLTGGWVAMLQHYFVSAWVPDPDNTYRFRTRQTRSGDNIIGYTGPAMMICIPETPPPLEINSTSDPKTSLCWPTWPLTLTLVVDYGWLWWIAQPLFWLLTMIQSIVINWGVAIILLTLLVKLAFFRLSAAGYKSMARMRKVQPRIQAIKEEYANDRG